MFMLLFRYFLRGLGVDIYDFNFESEGIIIMRKVLSVEPFNELYYRSCYYNPLLSGLAYYRGHVNGFLARDIFIYSFDYKREGLKLSFENKNQASAAELLRQDGVCLLEITESVNDFDYFKRVISDCICDNKLIFIHIDRYNWSNLRYNSKYYKQQHFPHFFLVYGFDDDLQTYSVVDSSVEECIANNISYEELFLCYMDYENMDSGKATMHKLDPIKEYPQFDYKTLFIDNVLKNKREIYMGLDALHEAVEYFSPISQLFMPNDVKSVARDARDIYWTKVTQMYQNKSFLGNNPVISELLQKLCGNMPLISGILVKYLITSSISNKSQNFLESTFLEFESLERKYYDVLLNTIGE